MKEPREGRLVIHGWFTEPRPFVEGGLARARGFARVLDGHLARLNAELATAGSFHGSLSLRADVAANGSVRAIHFLKNTLVDLTGREADPRGPERIARRFFRDLTLPRAGAASTVTIPILYRS